MKGSSCAGGGPAHAHAIGRAGAMTRVSGRSTAAPDGPMLQASRTPTTTRTISPRRCLPLAHSLYVCVWCVHLDRYLCRPCVASLHARSHARAFAGCHPPSRGRAPPLMLACAGTRQQQVIVDKAEAMNQFKCRRSRKSIFCTSTCCFTPHGAPAERRPGSGNGEWAGRYRRAGTAGDIAGPAPWACAGGHRAGVAVSTGRGVGSRDLGGC